MSFLKVNNSDVEGRSQKKRVISPAVFFFSLIVAISLSFAAGVYRTTILATIAPIFGAKISSDTLDTEQLQQTYRQLVANYDGTLDTDALINGASRGMVAAAGDKYTVFFDEKEAEQFNSDMQGSIGGGIGAQIGVRDNVITLVKIIANTPAEKAGLKAGDKVLAINNEKTEGFTTEQAVEKIRGEVGTTVKLAILRADEPEHTYTITRAEIASPSVESEVRDGIGILTIARFDQDTPRLARQAAQDFKQKGVRGVILDVRGNPGGYLTGAQDVSGLWLNDKVVVSERAGDKVVDELKSGRNPVLEGIPTIVLVDGNSASASEIVAGALKDHKAATLLGEKTYGKGTVQRLITLPTGAMLKVTVARWYTPNGINLSEGGLEPDTKVSLTEEDVRNQNDTQLKAAIEALKK